MNMPHRTKPTSKIHHGPANSTMGRAKLDLGVNFTPEPVRDALPELYGIPLLNLMVVDTEFVFISWEITSQQMTEARNAFGTEMFGSRKLMIRLHSADDDARPSTNHELYGETGRWFIRHELAGHEVYAELGFNCGERFFKLIATGNVPLPRNFIIEPEQYEEMHVEYGTGATGNLQLKSVTINPRDDWADPFLNTSLSPFAKTNHPDDNAGINADMGLPGSQFHLSSYHEQKISSSMFIRTDRNIKQQSSTDEGKDK